MTCACGSPAGSGPADDGSAGASAPQPVINAAGLTEIAYRVNDFAGFRQALLTPLPGEQQLTGWSPGPGDLGLQVLEWWAYLADILTFYNERIANEDYLHTAAAQPGPRRNVTRLARLLGYLPRPGITATGVVAALRSAGSADGTLEIPAGVQITSTPAAGVPAQVFETQLSDAGKVPVFTGLSDGLIVLHAEPTLFPSGTTAQQAVGGPEDAGTKQESVLLAGQVTVTRGEQLVLMPRNWDGSAGSKPWAVVTAGTTTTDPDPNGPPNTRLPVDSQHWHGLRAAQPNAGDYQLLRTQATAPLWTLPVFRSGTIGPDGSGSGSQAVQAADSTQSEITVPLATLVRNVAVGDNVLFTGTVGAGASRGDVQVLAHVISYHEMVTRVRSVPGSTTPVFMPHSSVRVRTTGVDVSTLENAIDNSELGGITMLYGFREVGTLIRTPAPSLNKLPATVTVPPGLAPPHAAAQVALQDANGTGLTVQATLLSPGSIHLESVDGTTQDQSTKLVAPIRLFAHLVNVSRGTSVRDEILGSGDPAAASQTFVLQHSPLIYLPASNGMPQTTLTVTVDGVTWKPVPAFSGQQPDATVYVVHELASGQIQIEFGDAINGARLPLGVSNVKASYKYGPATATPPPPGHLSTVLQPQPNLASVINPVIIEPGTDPEPAKQTAAAAPARVVLLGASAAPAGQAPVISAGDCESLAATVGGVTRVSAYWAWDRARERPAVWVYVGGSEKAEPDIEQVKNTLLSGGTPRIPLNVKPASAIQLTITCDLLCPQGTAKDDITGAAIHVLTDPHTGLFSPGQMAIGQRLYRSQVEAALTTTGAIAVLGLRIELPEAAGPGGSTAAGHGASVFDPGQDGYFSLLKTALKVNVVVQ
jgi:predicted phage baseplate assembly protein